MLGTENRWGLKIGELYMLGTENRLTLYAMLLIA